MNVDHPQRSSERPPRTAERRRHILDQLLAGAAQRRRDNPDLYNRPERPRTAAEQAAHEAMIAIQFQTSAWLGNDRGETR